jgi:hypothetical protein
MLPRTNIQGSPDNKKSLVSIKFLINLCLLHPEITIPPEEHRFLQAIRIFLMDRNYDSLCFYRLRWVFLILQQESHRHSFAPTSTDAHTCIDELLKSIEPLMDLSSNRNPPISHDSEYSNRMSMEANNIKILTEYLKIGYTFLLNYDHRWSISKFPASLQNR